MVIATSKTGVRMVDEIRSGASIEATVPRLC